MNMGPETDRQDNWRDIVLGMTSQIVTDTMISGVTSLVLQPPYP